MSSIDQTSGQKIGNYEKQDMILFLLKQLFAGKLSPGLSELTDLGENYVSIPEIVSLPQFSKENISALEIIESVHVDGKLLFSIRGDKIRLKPPELNKEPEVIISKKLSWILRHGAIREGFSFLPGGFLRLDDLLEHRNFGGITQDQVISVVETNKKRRFEVQEDEQNRFLIRAVQGHSVKVDSIEFTPITDPSLYNTVIHGTYYKSWTAIKRSGLSRMSRTHIHFAPGEVGDEGVISGMRSSVEVLIYIDMAAAMRDGIKFVLSNNNVILTEGNNEGILPTRYFSHVIDRKSRNCLEFESF